MRPPLPHCPELTPRGSPNLFWHSQVPHPKENNLINSFTLKCWGFHEYLFPGAPLPPFPGEGSLNWPCHTKDLGREGFLEPVQVRVAFS